METFDYLSNAVLFPLVGFSNFIPNQYKVEKTYQPTDAKRVRPPRKSTIGGIRPLVARKN
jgi:hypothetical protein